MKAEYISHMGNDLTVVNAARVSFDKSSEFENEERIIGVSKKDKGLIYYLATHGHWTPFSHPQITMRYTVPIFVARQEFKHIVGFTRNEVSRRYVDDAPEFYVPEVWRSRPEGSVKQGSGGAIDYFLNAYDERTESPSIEVSCQSFDYEGFCAICLDYYNSMLDDGVAPEQARMVLPQSMYTSYYVTGSLAAFARFVKQRTDPHAQVEIQELAQEVSNIIAPLYPVSWQALVGE
jgi:thymidylate synthase (FAD)